MNWWTFTEGLYIADSYWILNYSWYTWTNTVDVCVSSWFNGILLSNFLNFYINSDNNKKLVFHIFFVLENLHLSLIIWMDLHRFLWASPQNDVESMDFFRYLNTNRWQHVDFVAMFYLKCSEFEFKLAKVVKNFYRHGHRRCCNWNSNFLARGICKSTCSIVLDYWKVEFRWRKC